MPAGPAEMVKMARIIHQKDDLANSARHGYAARAALALV